MNLILLPFKVAFFIVVFILKMIKFCTMLILGAIGLVVALFFIIAVPLAITTTMVHPALYPNMPQANTLDLGLYIHYPLFWKTLLATYLTLSFLLGLVMVYNQAKLPDYENSNCERHTLKFFRQLRYDQITGKKR